ncbi:MAG TPA: M17 family peptidase N-terminal domain-containing protein [Nitrospirota bacterium]|nr:M17 family peptidase N-terminal domain-containing protein [Nitrospirota bacterium]
MPGLTVTVLLQDVKKLESEALVVGFFENVRPLKNLAGELDWLLCGALSNLIITHKLRGSQGDIALLTSQGKVNAQKIFMVGLGPAAALTPGAVSDAARRAMASVIRAGAQSAAMEFFPIPAASYDVAVPALWQGLSAGIGAAPMKVALLAKDAAAYDKILRLVHEQRLNADPKG